MEKTGVRTEGEEQAKRRFRGTVKVGRLRACLQAVAGVVNEVLLQFGSEGVEVAQMDESRTAAVNLRFGKEEFDQYGWTGAIRAGLRLGELVAAIRRADADALLEMEVGETLVLRGNWADKEQTWEFALLTLDGSSALPPLHFERERDVDASTLRNALADLKATGDDGCRLTVKRDGLRLATQGSRASVEIHLPRADMRVDDCETERLACAARFRLDLLEKVLAGHRLTSRARLGLGNGGPLRVTFADGSASIECTIAPLAET